SGEAVGNYAICFASKGSDPFSDRLLTLSMNMIARYSISVAMLFATFTALHTFAGDVESPIDPKDKLVVETVLRLTSFNLESSPPAKAAVLRFLRARLGTPQSFELIERFKPAEIGPDLTTFGLQHADESAGVRAMELLFAMEQQDGLV